jgi:oligopeptide transport system ATP-binding protein
MSEPVLEVRGLVKHFEIPRSRGGGRVHAVEGVDLTVQPGQLVGLVGESGSGKSTVGKCIVRLLEPTAGEVKLHGRDITHLSERQLRPIRREMNMVFQDPYSSLEPRMPIGAIVAEPLRSAAELNGRQRDDKVSEMLDRVGLGADMRFRYAHELSGGQRQRVGIARALIQRPSLLIADEPVSALDVSVQASILNLLLDLQRDMGFSCLFIAHDLATVEFLCNEVSVMYLGKIVEHATREQLFAKPRHPYSQSLLSAVVVPDPVLQRTKKRVVLEGDIPSPIDPPSGCRFHTRCPVAELPLCADRDPELVAPTHDGHLAACHLVDADGHAPDITQGNVPSAHH